MTSTLKRWGLKLAGVVTILIGTDVMDLANGAFNNPIVFIGGGVIFGIGLVLFEAAVKAET